MYGQCDLICFVMALYFPLAIFVKLSPGRVCTLYHFVILNMFQLIISIFRYLKDLKSFGNKNRENLNNIRTDLHVMTFL